MNENLTGSENVPWYENKTFMQAQIDITIERRRQEEKFPNQELTLVEWLAVLAEEFGEFAKDVVNLRITDEKKWPREGMDAYGELTQVAAVAVRIMEAIRDGRIKQ